MDEYEIDEVHGIRLSYNNIPYNNSIDNYGYVGLQEFPDYFFMPLYTGVKHRHTLSMSTLEKILETTPGINE